MKRLKSVVCTVGFSLFAAGCQTPSSSSSAGSASTAATPSTAPPPMAMASADDMPPVTAPPEAFFTKYRQSDRDVARKFYKKYMDVKGMAVVASGDVADAALQRTYWLVTHMLAGRPDVLNAMATNGTRLIIIGKDQVYTDMPEYRNSSNPAYQNERVRGTGGLGVTSFGEENLLCMQIDRYDDESIGLHEFCHTIDAALSRIDPTWRGRLRKTYQDAVHNGLWKNTYAGSNQAEYWGEVSQAYFDADRPNNWNHGPVARREQFKVYDPEGYELVRTTFNLGPDKDFRYSWSRVLPYVMPPPPQFKIDPYYTKFTWAREFTVIGHVASDQAMLKANDTIRKMFAYRHDILKALIADQVKLVVLGKGEHLWELPELKGLNPVTNDLVARFFDYMPETKILVAAEENVGANPNDPDVGCNQEIRVLAKAIYYVTASRPVDPNWNNRGRDVQQYELRLKRLDVDFGNKLKELYDAAMAKGLWKGTAAVHSVPDYWAEGVLAYFDALGQDAAPNDAPHPIGTRELLKGYDPDLYALVNETMAYDGHPDWRFPPATK
jgi:hypothetical protein